MLGAVMMLLCAAPPVLAVILLRHVLMKVAEAGREAGEGVRKASRERREAQEYMEARRMADDMQRESCRN